MHAFLFEVSMLLPIKINYVIHFQRFEKLKTDCIFKVEGKSYIDQFK